MMWTIPSAKGVKIQENVRIKQTARWSRVLTLFPGKKDSGDTS